MNADVALLSLENPVFTTYLVAAGLMILKLMLQPWITVFRMMKVGGGFRSPEDLKKTPLNPNPQPAQLEVNEYVDRSRRLNLNDLESIPGFLAAGLLFVLVGDGPLCDSLHAQSRRLGIENRVRWTGWAQNPTR